MAGNYNHDVIYGTTEDGTVVPLQVDGDGVLQSSATLSGSVTAGTEYTEGATDSTITGGVVMWEDGSDTIRAVSAAKPLPVAVISSAAGGDASAAKQDTGNTSLASIDTKTPALGQAVAGSSVPVVLPAAQITTLTPPAAITGFATETTLTTTNTELGATNETSAAADNSTSGLNGLLKRLLAQFTVMLARHPAALGGTTSANSFPVVLSSDGPFAVATGAITETAPATDTASSGLNGRLQRIAQRLSSIITTGIPITSVAIPTVIYNGLTNVTTAGTRVVLASSQAILSGVTIKARAANTGTIYVGSSTVSSANGYALAAGESVFLEIANLNTVNIDSSVNGEGVTFAAS